MRGVHERCSTQVNYAALLPNIRLAWKGFAMDKPSSLFGSFINCGRITEPNLTMILRLGWKRLARYKHSSLFGSFIYYGRILRLIPLGWKRLGGYKHSSLFGSFINYGRILWLVPPGWKRLVGYKHSSLFLLRVTKKKNSFITFPTV